MQAAVKACFDGVGSERFGPRETVTTARSAGVGRSPARTRPEGLRPIPADGLDEALPLLRRGFPERDRRFWEQGFAGLGARRCDGPIGYLFKARGEDVGVLLTFRSARVRPDGSRSTMVNLAGWYVEPEHRWKAPMMLRRVVSEPGAVFTDLTPSRPVERINTALGFEASNEGQVMLFLLPWAAMPARGEVEVTAEDEAAASAADRDLAERHAAMGCVAAYLRDGEGVSLLLFKIARRGGLRYARLIYAGSRRAVLANRTALARFLVARGILVLVVDADRAECPRGSFFREGRRTFTRGAIDRDRVDYAFSELVLLDFDA